MYPKKRIFLIIILIMFLASGLLTGATDNEIAEEMDISADVHSSASYSNYIDIENDQILFDIKEEYTGEYADNLRRSIDLDGNGYINETEIDTFIDNYLEIRTDDFREYIIINDGNTELSLVSVTMELDGAEGNTSDNGNVSVMTTINYELTSSLSAGEHRIWILGHPLIREKEIILPKNTEIISYQGLDESQVITDGERDVLKGKSGISSFSINDQASFEYATRITIHKKAFYEHPYFLPFLGLIQLMLIILAAYSIKREKKKDN